MWAVKDASRLARPMDMIEIRLKCKHFIRFSDHVHGVLNSYKKRYLPLRTPGGCRRPAGLYCTIPA